VVTSTVNGGPHSGAPFEPLAAAAKRIKRVRQEFVEAAEQRKEAHKQELRALGRKLDEEQREARRAARRQYFDEVDAAYAERFGAARREREQFMQRIGKRSRVRA